MEKKIILFTVSAGNLGDTTALIEVARACLNLFEPVFIAYGYQYAHLIRRAGFPVHHELFPPFNRKKPDVKKLRQRVETELKLWQKYEPVAIVNRHEITPVISARAAGVPLVWLLPFAYSRPCFASSLGGNNSLDIIRHWFEPGEVIPEEEALIQPYQIVAQQLKTPPIHTVYDFFEGDYTLLSDVPEITGVSQLPPHYHYVGPIFARLEGEIPEAIHNLPQDRPIIYFALGSSGHPLIVKNIIEGFAQRPSYSVIAPVKGYLLYFNQIENIEVKIPANVLVTDWLPAHKVNALADISVTNGGLGTLYTACLAGTPIVGISMHKEQEINLDFLARLKCATHISRQTVTAQAVLESVDHMLTDKTAQQQMQMLQKKLSSWNGPENVNRFLQETFTK